ncbi:phage tail sheath family protein [Undibacterium sp. SXout7W]|uniref:phage tail sheath family protein n=1 Tax=Undibacterium sp. SXout7W TaxID=3413049 RepID=UPI003BF34F01
MAAQYQTPGVYIAEVNGFSTAVVEVPTAVPVFIGYTETAFAGNKSLVGVPTAITSMADFLTYFALPGSSGAPAPDYTKFIYTSNSTAYPPYVTAASTPMFYLYYSLLMFFNNGGSNCYIVSLGSYSDYNAGVKSVTDTSALITSAFSTLQQYAEPTILVIPDAMMLNQAEWTSVSQAALVQCNTMQTQVTILDVRNGWVSIGDTINSPISSSTFYSVNGLGEAYNKYGIAYYPWVNTDIVSDGDIDFTWISDQIDAYPFNGTPPTPASPISPLTLLKQDLVTEAQAIYPVNAAGYYSANYYQYVSIVLSLAIPYTDTPTTVSTTTSTAATAADATTGAAATPSSSTTVTTTTAAFFESVNTVTTTADLVPGDGTGTVVSDLVTTNRYFASAITTDTSGSNILGGSTSICTVTTTTNSSTVSDTNTTTTSAPVTKYSTIIFDDVSGSSTTSTTAPAFIGQSLAVGATINGGTITSNTSTTVNGVTTNIIVASNPAVAADNTASPPVQAQPASTTTYTVTNFTYGTAALNASGTTAAVAAVQSNNQTIYALSSTFQTVIADLGVSINLLPPSGGMAGVYARTDNTFGVYQSPANTTIINAVTPAVNITDAQQAGLNVPLNGLAVNAIRTFPNYGLLVWGARTMAGNSDDWRYINVRRTMIMLEQSIKNAMQAYVFASNDSLTWVNVNTTITNFLTQQWASGALVGAKASDAFTVAVGLGTTMTSQDILAGIMNVKIGVAVVRPAEFIVLTFQQQMQKS